LEDGLLDEICRQVVVCFQVVVEFVFDGVLLCVLVVVVVPAVGAGCVGAVFVLFDGVEKCVAVAVGHEEFDRQRSTHYHTGSTYFMQVNSFIK